MAPHVRTATRLFCAVLGAAAAAGFAATADAATYAYKLYDGGPGYTGPFAGTGTVYELTKSLAFDTAAAGSTVNLKPDKGDYVDERMTFGGGIRPTMTATAGALHVWQDIAPAYGGLGVGNAFATGHDEVDGTDILRLSFDAPLYLRGVGTLFVDIHEEENFTSSAPKHEEEGQARQVPHRQGEQRAEGRPDQLQPPAAAQHRARQPDALRQHDLPAGGGRRTLADRDHEGRQHHAARLLRLGVRIPAGAGSQDFYLSALIVNAPVPGKVRRALEDNQMTRRLARVTARRFAEASSSSTRWSAQAR